MVKHNNVVPNQHFKKKWQFSVKTWFNQPARKVRRRKARVEKAKKVFPRPASGPLRPVVQCVSQRYNMKQRYGKGFTFDELKAAGINKRLAPTIGIAVDHRRKNLSEESLAANVERLKAYKSNLLLFPQKSGKPKAGDSSAEDLAKSSQLTGPVVPIKRTKAPLEFVKVTPEMQAARAYYTLRLERTNQRLEGKRKKRQAEKEAEERDKMK